MASAWRLEIRVAIFSASGPPAPPRSGGDATVFLPHAHPDRRRSAEARRLAGQPEVRRPASPAAQPFRPAPRRGRPPVLIRTGSSARSNEDVVSAVGVPRYQIGG